MVSRVHKCLLEHSTGAKQEQDRKKWENKLVNILFSHNYRYEYKALTSSVSSSFFVKVYDQVNSVIDLSEFSMHNHQLMKACVDTILKKGIYLFYEIRPFV